MKLNKIFEKSDKVIKFLSSGLYSIKCYDDLNINFKIFISFTVCILNYDFRANIYIDYEEYK